MGWLNTKVNPLKMVGVGLVLYPIGLLFLGPSLALGFPEEKGLVIAGLCILGFGLATVLVPSVNIMIGAGLGKAEEERKKLDLPEQSEKANKKMTELVCDQAGAMFNIAYCLGSISGPILGGALDQSLEFRRSADVMTLVALCIFLLYFCAVILAECCREKPSPSGEDE